MSDLVLAAIVTGGFGVIVALIQVLKRENKKDHNENAKRLDRVIEGVGAVRQRLEDHIEDHNQRRTR